MYKTIILFLSLVGLSAYGQGTLIGPTTRNGSFENGVALPWGGVATFQDLAFASQGNWFARAQAIGNGSVARTDSFQYLPATPGNGFMFRLTFDARIGSVGFESVGAFVSANNGDGTFVAPIVTSVATPTIVAVGWVTYQYQFQFPEVWDGGGSVRLGIGFTKNGAINGTTYTGFLDNIVLQQIPEPSSFALFGLGGLFLAAGRHRRRGNTASKNTKARQFSWRA